MENKIKIIKAIMLLLFILGGSGLCLADDKAQASDWYSPDWEYRKAITIDNTLNASALTDYQVLITLNAGNFDYAHIKDGLAGSGDDLRFTDSDKLTEIYYWIEEWNTGGDSKIWVKVPFIAASSEAIIYLYYGNDNIDLLPESSFDDSMQKLEADADTAALWHFDEGTGTTLGDASSNGNDGAMYDFAIDNSDWVSDSTSEYGGSGGALNFDGVDNYVEVFHDDSLNFNPEDFTIEGWIKTSETSHNDMILMNKREESDNDRGYYLYLNKEPDYALHYFIYGEPMIESGIISDTPINDGNWHHIVALGEGTKMKMYIDGEFEKEVESPVLAIKNFDNPASLIIGTIIYFPNIEDFYKGQLDEFRISTRALSADEIKANYEKRQYAATEPTNSLGAEETDPYDVSETVVAADGGTVVNAADTVDVEIPANALASDTDITIDAGEAIGDFQVQGIAPIDYIYTFGPEGTTFSIPVILTFDYDDIGMTLEEEQGLDIYLYNETLEIWEAQGAIVDTDFNTLTLSVTHFSDYVVGRDITVLGKVDELLLLINNYYEEGKIEKFAYSLNVHLKIVQRLTEKGKIEKAVDALERFIEKVERFTPNKIDSDVSMEIITRVNEIISLL
ncbi:DUF2341 domain-containing protein [Candidatus Parcubacteria bacterium]|nr:DUF2341 domain-containing protein [Candidatus Parcubacteria bacterium]